MYSMRVYDAVVAHCSIDDRKVSFVHPLGLHMCHPAASRPYVAPLGSILAAPRALLMPLNHPHPSVSNSRAPEGDQQEVALEVVHAQLPCCPCRTARVVAAGLWGSFSCVLALSNVRPAQGE
jgi:hypothetical protein